MNLGALTHRSPLHGRDDELTALHAALNGAIGGSGRLVLVAGQAGIGKTALVEAIAAAAADAGAVVLAGHGYDLDTAAPYGPWIELLRSYTSSTRDALPELPPGLGNAELLEAMSGKDALFEQVTGFLDELATPRPVVVVLEDLHWSDQASLELLRTVARRAPDWRLLIVATFRDDELTPRQPLHRVLPLLVREARPLRIDLRPLGSDAIRRFVAERYGLPPADEARLVRHLQRYAEGNPFYVEELLRTLEHERLVRETDDGWAVADLAVAPVPPLVRQLIEERVARLGEPVQRLLQIAAVIGSIVPPDLWQAVADADDEAFADAVDQARQAHLLEETPDRAALRFTHALVREAIYDGVALPRRRSWHRQVAERLSAGGQVDPDAVAHHLLQAGDPAAADWLIRAGQRAERRDASWDAVARFEQALPLLERQGDAATLAWLHTDLAESYRYIDPMKSATHLDAAEQVARGMDDPVLSLAIRWLRARLRGFLGQRVFDDLRDSVSALDALSPADRQRLDAMGRINLPSRGLLAQWMAFLGRYDEAVTYAESVLNADLPADSAVRRNELGGAYIALGLAHAGRGRPEEARDAFGAAAEQFRAIDSSFMTASTLKWEIIEVAMAYATEDLEERRRLVEEYAKTMARMSSFAVFRGAQPLLQVFGPDIVEGRWAEAREAAVAYLHVPAWRVSALAALGNLERRQGRPSAAWNRVRSGIPGGVETEPGNLYFVDTLRLQRLAADLALDEGHPDLALSWIDAHDHWLDWSGRALDRAAGLLLRSRYHAALGERDRARELARQALIRAEEPRQPLSLLAAHRALGALAIEAGAFTEAEQHLDAALSLAEACAALYERALTSIEQGRLLRAQGRGDEATALLEDARATLTRLGATPALERLSATETRGEILDETELPAGLSPREAEVLRLVARGLSYADVADQLYISPRTVARHLQSIYNKLGVDSRAAAAAFAFDHGLV